LPSRGRFVPSKAPLHIYVHLFAHSAPASGDKVPGFFYVSEEHKLRRSRLVTFTNSIRRLRLAQPEVF